MRLGVSCDLITRTQVATRASDRTYCTMTTSIIRIYQKKKKIGLDRFIKRKQNKTTKQKKK